MFGSDPPTAPSSHVMPPTAFPRIAFGRICRVDRCMTNPVPYRELLRIDGLAALLAATTFSRLASRMFSLAIVLYALERFSSPALAGWLSFAAIAPGLIVSPLAGAFLDRFGSVTGMAVDMGASALFIVTLLIADMFGWDDP